MAYANATTVKQYLDIPDTSSDDDALLNDLCEAAKQYIDTATGYTFESFADDTLTFDAVENVDGRFLTFDGMVLASITSITNGDGVEVESDEYVTEPRNAGPYYAVRLLSSSGKSWTYTTDPEDAITVVGRQGWSVEPSYECQHAATVLAAQWYRQKDSIGDSTRAIITGSSVLSAEGMPRQVTDFIAKFKRLS